MVDNSDSEKTINWTPIGPNKKHLNESMSNLSASLASSMFSNPINSGQVPSVSGPLPSMNFGGSRISLGSTNSRQKKYSFRKVSIGDINKQDKNSYINDINLMFSRDDKFIGNFSYGKNISLERSYIESNQSNPKTPTESSKKTYSQQHHSIYFTKIYHNRKTIKAQLVMLHGFTSSSNFVEVSLD